MDKFTVDSMACGRSDFVITYCGDDHISDCPIGVMVPMTMSMTGYTIYKTWQLEDRRNKLRAITGTDFNDDQWSFGQTIAVCIWILPCLMVIYYSISAGCVSFLLNSILSSLRWLPTGCSG